jgi:hypothetical protein
MHLRKSIYAIPILLGALLLVLPIVFWPTSQADAQCGSQASSCKNCHEVQGQDPVNNDGTSWHQAHAFGDFCYICHAGNNQATDKTEAHNGMVPPLSDIKAACQSCHPNDLMDRAQVYATVLGVDVGSGGSTPSDPAQSPSSGSDAPVDSPSNPSNVPAGDGLVVDASSDVIDYNLIYDETVLGKRPINWGNLILGFMIVVVAAGGGTFVFWNERRLRGLTGKPAARQQTALDIPLVEGYSTEVTALLPLIASLNPPGLHALKKLLQNPDEASELLHSLSKLDPELIQRIRSLDRESKAMLLALAGD